MRHLLAVGVCVRWWQLCGWIQIAPKNQYRHGNDESQYESLLLFHSNSKLPDRLKCAERLKAATSRRTPKLLHRIVPAHTKGLTAQEPPHGHSAPAQRAVALNCFTRIFGTSRNKTTRRRQPRRDYCFVELQQRNKNGAHCLNITVTSGALWSAWQFRFIGRHRFRIR